VNRALDLFEYKPVCPFSVSTLFVKISVTAINPEDKSLLWGQVVTVDMGDAVVVKGKAQP
jgi:hypothetical protein